MYTRLLLRNATYYPWPWVTTHYSMGVTKRKMTLVNHRIDYEVAMIGTV
jgi:hypothetical protein